MKKLLLLSTFALSTTAFGQSPHLRGRVPATCNPARTAAKTTADNAARCIAIGVNYHLGAISMLVDSETYVYSGSRGGSPMGLMKYDNGNVYQNTGSGVENIAKYVQTFDSHNNILVHTEQQYDGSTSSFVNYVRTTYTYDAANNPLTEINETWDVPTSAWVNSFKYINTYTAFNKLNTTIEQQWTGTSWDNYSLDTFTYNSSNNVILDLRSNWSGSSSTWTVAYQTTFTYDGSGNVATQLFQSWAGSAWSNQYKTTFSNYAAPGLYQKAINQIWSVGASAFINAYNDSITYSSYNQPVYLFERDWSSTTSSWVPDTFIAVHFYYQLYSTGIANVNSSATAMDVYPNPTSGIINLRADVADSRNTTITVQDVAGRIVHSFDGREIKDGLNNIQLSMEQLPAGAYFVHLANDKANITRKVVITK
jgi:hypothetical protein